MSDWNSGYRTDIGYSYGYYRDLNPLRLPFAFLNAGIGEPKTEVACDLGFGQGLSIAIHSAASPVTWWGTDFNPEQAGFARAMSRAAGSKAHLLDDSFEEFFARPDLPEFDFIGMHGIWTWISDGNRALIVDFLRRKLKVGGVLFISYNTFPGWSTFYPMRHLLAAHAATYGAVAHGIATDIDAALAFGQRLLATNPAYGMANPQVMERMARLMNESRSYLAHEYFNHDWQPMHFTDMNRWLASAKLTFAGSADLLDRIEQIHLTPEQNALLDELADPTFREQVKDFMLNRQFRREYWVKGLRRASPLEAAEGIGRQSIVMSKPRADISLRIAGRLGEVTLQEDIYVPILDALADYQPTTVAALAARLGNRVAFQGLWDALTVLLSKDDAISPAQDQGAIAAAQPGAARLNAFLMEKARVEDTISCLASPVTGGGVFVPRIEQLFLLARARGEAQSTWAESTWRLLDSQAHRLIIGDGNAVASPAEELRFLADQARQFASTRLPVLKGLGIA